MWFGKCVTRWRRWRRRDGVIDELISQNQARPLPAMEAVDWSKVDRAGQQRWQETLQAQRRRPSRTSPVVMRFGKRG